MSAGAEHGYTYQGDASSYVVTLLGRPNKLAAKVKIERCIKGEGSIPVGATVTIPMRKLTARSAADNR